MNIELDKRGLPLYPVLVARCIEANQEKINGQLMHRVLFNKGSYFETSIYHKETLDEVCSLIGLKPKLGTMVCGSWNKLEDFVTAMNCLGYRVTIDIDWI